MTRFLGGFALPLLLLTGMNLKIMLKRITSCCCFYLDLKIISFEDFILSLLSVSQVILQHHSSLGITRMSYNGYSLGTSEECEGTKQPLCSELIQQMSFC